MDDPRTRQSIDELADLYLTGVDAPRAADTGTDPLTGPPPIRLAPKIRPGATLDANLAPAHAAAAEPAAHAEGHPILRLTDAGPEDNDATPPRKAQGPPRANARAVILGNLPGLSGPWLIQYAQRLAQEHGPVAVLHVDDQAIDLELVEPRPEAQPAPQPQAVQVRLPQLDDGGGLVALLDALVRSSQSPVQTVLVRLAAEPEPMSASRLSALDDWTVLTGADDAAVVACYRLLKQVVEHDPRNAGKSVGLMVMGSDDDAAHRAADKVAATADSFLDTPVALVGQQRQMQPVAVRQLGSFPDPVALWPELVAWLDKLEPPTGPMHFAEPAPAETETAAAPEPTIVSPLRVPPPRSAPRVRAGTPRTQEPTPAMQMQASPAASIPPAPSAPRTARPVAQEQAPDPSADLDLAALLAQGNAMVQEPTVLEARIPTAPRIQLALDAQGAVHVLFHHGPADDPRRAIAELSEARRWVEEHHALLTLTERGRAFADPKQHPLTLHLFTDRAEQATALVARLGDAVKLHLLQKVTLGRETGWFCTPLNA